MDELNRVIAGIMADSGGSGSEQTEDPASESPRESEKGENALPAGLMNLIAGLGQPSGQHMELLLALKPHMGREKQEKVERICSLVRTAYLIRGTLSSLGGMIDV